MSPNRVGPYTILDTLGEGGMGTVYLAEQQEPIHRRVALKVVKPGMDTRSVVARFESERQILALLDHPGIAQVYDAGSADGRPYFAMEYVPGVPITDYCDQNRLDIPGRLRLFLTVCDAVQHAHQRAIIHRDLKPSNILVTSQDGRPVPKIIDFGVAKATQRRLTRETVFTEHGQVIGTPAYMSPEQAEMTALDVDTRTDVYSLGVLLYELLAGVLPFDAETFRQAGYLGIQRLIREVDPPTPSTRLARLGEEARAVARLRRLELRALAKELRGDLDWIVTKAMEKDRTRRYATASELAQDISRHLRHVPVLAGPPSTAYRLRKLLERHPLPAAAAAVIAMILVAGAVASTGLFLEARESARRADEHRSTVEAQMSVAERNERAAREQRALAERRLASVRRLADTKLLADYEAAARQLWPCIPSKVEAMERWLHGAGELAARLDRHRHDLESLRARFPEDEAGEGSGAGDGPRRRFPRAELRWRHELLQGLVEDLETFCDPDPRVGTIASVRRRLETARTIRERSIESRREAWDRAIRSIADPAESPAYEGLRIEPQIGLVPVGRDPQSGLWEFAHLDTGGIAARQPDGRLRLEEDSGLVFVLVPGGRFRMGAVPPGPSRPEGSPNVDPAARDDESPVRELRVDPFFFSKFEMNKGQWLRATGEDDTLYGSEILEDVRGYTLLHPIERVGWTRAREVMKQLGLSLPTEAQWEYAARAGTTTVWPTGDRAESLAGAANLRDLACKTNPGTSAWTFEEWLDDGAVTHAPVGGYRANGFGLHDVIGNVSEWCADAYGPYAEAPSDTGRARDVERRGEAGTGGEGEATGRRVHRGGSWQTLAEEARSASRAAFRPAYRFSYLGLRPARALEGWKR